MMNPNLSNQFQSEIFMEHRSINLKINYNRIHHKIIILTNK